MVVGRERSTVMASQWGINRNEKGVLQFSDRLHSIECVPCWRELKVSDGKCNDQGVGEKTFAQKILSLEDKVIS